MKNKRAVTIGIIALILVILAVSYYYQNGIKESAMMDDEGSMMKEGLDSKSTDSLNSDSMTGGEMMKDYSGKILAGDKSLYLEFEERDYEIALNENKTILLDFYANWCPVCKAEQPETISAFNSLEDENIIGFRVNYKDSDTDKYEENLAKEFGIAYQHTKVIIMDGKQVLKSPDSWNKGRFVEELNKYS